MEIKVEQTGSVRFSVRARTHTIMSDQPRENGGEDTGMTPPELLLASLGSCAAYYAAEYLRARGLSDSGVRVTVHADKLKQPARLGNFQIEVNSPAHLSDEQQEAMTRAVSHCLVHNTLLSAPEIAIDVKAGIAEAADLGGHA